MNIHTIIKLIIYYVKNIKNYDKQNYKMEQLFMKIIIVY